MNEQFVEHNGVDGRWGITINGHYMERHEVRELHHKISIACYNWKPFHESDNKLDYSPDAT